jgi:mono/diheme cytochrome c family protein
MRAVAVLIALAVSSGSFAATPVLTVGKKEYAADELLRRGDVVSLTVPDDVSYHRSMTYRVVPLRALVPAAQGDHFDTLEAKATDGFVAQIPLSLVTQGAALPYLAVEDPAHPWPALPNERKSAGPFYVVWDHPQRSDIRSEQWPFALASLTLTESPVHRWPQLASHSAGPLAQSGQKVFVSYCLPCHQLNGAGVGKVGPDLGRPTPVLHYITEPGLRAIVRNPAGVRTWPEQHMAGFDAKALPDGDLDALVAYLKSMAGSHTKSMAK